jgi:hypothetical protein
MEIELGANEVKPVAGEMQTHVAADTVVETTASSAADATQTQTVQLAIAAARVIRSANWFYWIAGLSAINVMSGAFGATMKFIIGLGISEVFTAIATGIAADGGSTTSVALLYAASLGVTAFFAACGWFARRPSTVAFVVGMVAFALDTLIFVYVSDWIGVAFHAYVLFNLWRGFAATSEYKKLQTL